MRASDLTRTGIFVVVPKETFAAGTLFSDVSIDGERMSNEKEDQAGKQPVIKLQEVTFDENGEIVGLDDDVLDNVSGGLTHVDPQSQCDCNC